MPSPQRKIARRHLLAGSAAAIAAPFAAGSMSAAPAAASPRRRTPSLELDPKSYLELDADFLQTQTANYARIKRLRDGRFLLTYQTSPQAWSVYFTTSPDLKHWATPQLLFATHKILDGTDDKCYSSADSRVLNNGDILAVCSFRANRQFSTNMLLDGLVLRRSTDQGRSWGPEQVIYVGANWEPFVHQTETGEIQVYFTQGAPKRAVQGVKGSTGVGLIRSFDGGHTWTPNVTGYPFAADRVAQQYTRTTADGVKMFTDQMPSALQTHPHGSIALAMESHLANGDYMISLAYTSNDWPVDLAMDETGPADRQSNLFLGAAPYLARFPSGESVLAYNQASHQQIRLGDRWAREFGDPVTFLPGSGYWGSIELIAPRRLATTMANVRPDGSKIMIGVLNLVRH